ncbi:MAG: dihydrolipoyl dehydrogenase [Dehalococcoidia bacterium]|nr:dihydrolipoyl dehydrogenase [Dehalococcoidia bacterium]
MTSQKETFDLIIVGGGTGGYVAAIRAAQLGMRVAVIEKEKMGGACLHRGCIPTKALLESAEVYSLARRSEEFGVTWSDVKLDYSRTLKRKDAIVARLHAGVEFLIKKNKITAFKGRGRLLSPTKVAVLGDDGSEIELEAADTVLATGSVPNSVPGLGFDGTSVINSDHAVRMGEVPSSVIILGAGAIGVEFATLYNKLGAEVTLLARRRVLPLEDLEVSEEIARLFTRKGIKVLAGIKVLSETFRKEGDTIHLSVQGKEETYDATGQKLLIAAGRSGEVDGLGLDALPVKMEGGFVKVDRSMRTGVPHLYAIGDLIGGMLLAHVAMHEGIMAVETIAGEEPDPLDYNRVPRGTYCQPQVGSVGLSEQDAVAQGHKVKIGKFPFRANGRALIAGEADGFVKVVADAEKDEILGVHILGPQATELIMEPALAKYLGATAWEMGSSIHAHPTLAEVLREAALAVDGKAIHI